MRDFEAAQNNLPTLERYAKGDVIIHMQSERSTIPTASIRVPKDRLQKLFQSGVINSEQHSACCKFRSWHQTAIGEVIQKLRIATWQNAGTPRGQWQSNVEDALYRQWCYNYLRNQSNGLSSVEMNTIERVVCHDEPIRNVLKGNGSTKTERFVLMVERLKKTIDSMPKAA